MVLHAARWAAAMAMTAIAAAVLLSAAAAGGQEGPAAGPKWWQKGQSGWVYMDDWAGKYLRGARTLKKTFEVPGPVKAACIQCWSSGGLTLVVNGKAVPRDPNGGPVPAYDITALIVQGSNTIELRDVGEAVAEGGVALADGREVAFATDESWAEGGRVQASSVRREGSRGYMGDYHVGKVLRVTTRQRARAAVNDVNLTCRRLSDDLELALWRLRDPAEVLTADQTTGLCREWHRVFVLLADALHHVLSAQRLILAGKDAEALAAIAPAEAKVREALGLYEELMAKLRSRAKQRLDALAGGPAAPGVYRQLNGSAVNRLGWVASCEPLDSDPEYWEFDIAPPGARTLGLAGLWQFRIDQKQEVTLEQAGGAEPAPAGFTPIYAPTKWGWERWGHDAPDASGGVNKPYNGLAWYAKTLTIPASWAGGDLVLRLGVRWNNSDWLAVNGTWVNPPEKDPRGNSSGSITIPAALIRFGKPNALVLRVLNRTNIGGIVNPGLRLSVSSQELAGDRSPVGPASVRNRLFLSTKAGPVTQITYSSALSPGVIVATTAKAIRLHGWVERGYLRPNRFAVKGKEKVNFGTPAGGTAIDPQDMHENWLLLWSDAAAPAAPRPLLVVFEKRPAAIRFTNDAAEPAGVQFDFAAAGARIVLIHPLDGAVGKEPTEDQLARVRFWSRALLRYPVGYAEQTAFEGDTCKVRMAYEYVDLADDWKTEPLTLAPLPMLFSYALEHRWPGAKAEGEITDLGGRARSGFYPQMDCGTYRAAVGQSRIAYQFSRMEPKRHYCGVGTLGEERPLGQGLVENLHRWGFNSTRPQIPFQDRSWGLFESYGRPAGTEPKVKLDGDGARFLDDLIGWHRQRDMTCFLNWFWDFGGGGWNEARGRQIEALWAALARRYADQPPGAVAYSLLNEPAGIPWAQYNAFTQRLTRAIRAHDKAHLISVESAGGWAQPEDLDMTIPTGDENTIYQFHFYGPHKEEFIDNPLYPRYNRPEDRWRSYEGWEERMLSPIRFQIRTGREVMHGEFGISHLSADGAAEGWLEDVLAIHQKYRMHWNWWHYNGSGTYRTGLVARDHTNPLLPILRKYAAMPAP